MRLLLVPLLAVALPLSGCSFLFVDGPSASRPPTIYPSCDEERTIPVVDLVLVGVYGLAGITAATPDDDHRYEDNYSDDKRDQMVTSALIGVALFGASAWYGFSKTGSCRAARAQYRQQLGDPRLAPPMQPMPYGGPAAEGQQCHPQAGCQPGLACASGLCVRFQQPAPALPPAPPPPEAPPPPPAPGPPPPSGTQPWPPPATP